MKILSPIRRRLRFLMWKMIESPLKGIVDSFSETGCRGPVARAPFGFRCLVHFPLHFSLFLMQVLL